MPTRDGDINPSASETAARNNWVNWPQTGSLSGRRTHLVAMSVACVAGRFALLADIIGSARARHRRRIPFEEALLQCYLFAGYPRAIEGLAVLQDLWPRRRRAPGVIPRQWQALGTRLCRRVYGPSFRKLQANMAATHPDLSVWLVTEGYGKVLSRPGLDGLSRELCAVATLATLPAPRQLDAHVAGARNLGANEVQITAAVELAKLGCSTRTWKRSLARVSRRLRAVPAVNEP
jgi:alkylhydroperoxidase/carboxymuconolactone decarboxylase family protein YurZ